MSDAVLNDHAAERRRILISLAVALAFHAALVIALALGAGSAIEPVAQPPISIDVQITTAPTSGSGGPSAGAGGGVNPPSYEPATVPVPAVSGGGGAAGANDFVIPTPRSAPDATTTTGVSGPAFREAGGRTGVAQSLPSVQEQSTAAAVPPVQTGRGGSGSGTAAGAGSVQRSGEGVTVRGPASSGSGGNLDLSQLDRAISGSGAVSGTGRSGTGSGSGAGAGTGSGTGGGNGSGQEAGTGTGAGSGGGGSYSVQWEQPSAAQGRRLLSAPAPRVPKFVGEQGLTLSMTVAFTLTPDGVVSGVTIERSSGYAEVDALVREAIGRWRFTTTTTPGNVRGVIPYVIKAE